MHSTLNKLIFHNNTIINLQEPLEPIVKLLELVLKLNKIMHISLKVCQSKELLQALLIQQVAILIIKLLEIVYTIQEVFLHQDKIIKRMHHQFQVLDKVALLKIMDKLLKFLN
jgi:hypothetical protein